MNRQMSQKSGAAHHAGRQSFTDKQGQDLAFIYTYSHIFRQAPAEADMQRHFRVRWSSTSSAQASFGDSPASPEASNSSYLQKPCPSWNGSNSTRHNHCDEVLVRSSFPDRKPSARVGAAL
jgi:hypothetical protein